MATLESNPDAFLAGIGRHVRQELEALVEREAEAAAERVRAKARELSPQLVMQLLSYFQVERDRHNIVITVRDTSTPEAGA